MDIDVTKIRKIVTLLSTMEQVPISGHQYMFECIDWVFTNIPAKFYVPRPYCLLTTRGFWIVDNKGKRP